MMKLLRQTILLCVFLSGLLSSVYTQNICLTFPNNTTLQMSNASGCGNYYDENYSYEVVYDIIAATWKVYDWNNTGSFVSTNTAPASLLPPTTGWTNSYQISLGGCTTPYPTIYNITGSNTCAGNSTTIGLSNSTNGDTYTLKRGTTTVATMTGTGSAISFGSQSTTGHYTVEASNANGTLAMSGSVSINDVPTLNIVGTTVGTPSVSLSVADNKAIQFTGTISDPSYVSIPDAPSLDLTYDYTLEAWIKTTSDEAVTQAIISKQRSLGGDGYVIGLTSDGSTGNQLWAGSNGDNSLYAAATTTIPINTWTHVAATFTRGTIKLYINGSLVKQEDSYCYALVNSTEPLTIGYEDVGPTFSRPFKGQIDEVRIWNVARSDAEISADMSKQVAASTNLVAYYSFSEGTGTTVTDKSIYGNNGSFAGTTAPTWVVPTDRAFISTYAWSTGSTPTTASNTFTSTGTYTVTVTATDGNGCSATATQQITVGTTLPVELLSFSGKYIEVLNPATGRTEGGNLLTWQTANEVNNKGFHVDRLNNLGGWDNLGFVAAAHKVTDYQFTDKTPLSMSSYRLRQIDNDGKETLSKVITLQIIGSKGSLKVYPNPASNSLSVEVTAGDQTIRDYQVFNLLGQQVLTGKTSPSEVARLDVSTLPTGTYYLKVGAEQVKFMKY